MNMANKPPIYLRPRALFLLPFLCGWSVGQAAEQTTESEGFSKDLPSAESVLRSINLFSLPDMASGTTLSIEDVKPDDAMQQIVKPALDVAAQNAHPIRIEDVRLMALANNLGLQVQFGGPAIAADRVSEEEARFDALFSGSLSFNNTEQPGNPGSPPLATRGYNANLQLDLPLRSGGAVSLALPTTLTDPDIPNIDDIQDTSLSLSISQPLLRNAGSAIATIPIELAKLQSSQELARTKLSAIQTLAASESAYWDFYSASNILTVRQAQFERAVDLQRKAVRLAEAGVVVQIEVTRAKSGVARKLEGIILAETQRKIVQRELKRQLNDDQIPFDDDTPLDAKTLPDPLFYELSPKNVAEEALKNRTELIELQLQLTQDELAALFAENQLKPALDLVASSTFAGRDDSLGSSLGNDFTTWQIGATIQVPIGNRAAKARHRNADRQTVLTRINVERQRRAISQQVFDALDRLNQSWQRILASRQETLLAAATYDAEERQFLAGVRTSTDVLESADFLAEAQIREISALSAYEKDKINAALVTGTLLGKGNIQLEIPTE